MEKYEALKYLKSIETERLIIRRMQRSDAEDMYEYAKCAEVTEYLLWKEHASIDYTRAYLSAIQKHYRAGTYFDYAVVLKEENRMIGTCGFSRIDKADNAAEIGYVINPAYQRRGYASEAVIALMRLGFCDMGMNRIEGRYMVKNLASRKVMEKCGMTFEGVCRELMLVKGRYEDIGICSCLRREFIFRFGPDGSGALCTDLFGKTKPF